MHVSGDFYQTWDVQIPQNRVCRNPVDDQVPVGGDRCIEAAIWRDQIVTISDRVTGVESFGCKCDSTKEGFEASIKG